MLFSVLSGFLIFCGFFALSIVLLVRCRLFYHILVGPLRIAVSSGLPTKLILRNYDHLIDYCSPFYRGELSFPDFPSSASALSHFAETKRLFGLFYLAAPLCFLSALLLTALKARVQTARRPSRRRSAKRSRNAARSRSAAFLPCRKQASFRAAFRRGLSSALAAAGILGMLVPAVCLFLFASDFHGTFWLMHKILFQNDDWIFNAGTDPVITILPERYFLCCGIALAAALLLFSAAALRLGRQLVRATSSFPAAAPKAPSLPPQEMPPIFLPARKNTSDTPDLPNPNDGSPHPS